MEASQSTFKSFLKRKDIEFSAKRYLQDALSAMALGLFASLLIGLIIKTIGEQSINLFGDTDIAKFLIKAGGAAGKQMGAAIGVAVAWGLKSPPLVMFASTITGMMGAELGGPAGSFVAVVIAAEFGKMISKETKIDIIITPMVTILIGAITAALVGPGVQKLMLGLGAVIMDATQWQPFAFGIFISIVVGWVLTAPISSAALCIMMGLSGLAAGAATVGCCAQMVGFAAISYKENGIGGVLAQGLGTSMLQVPNIIKNPWIIVPPTVASAIVGPLATCVFMMTNNPVGAGMGTSGLVGQIGTFTDMGFTMDVLVKVGLLHIILPVIISIIVDRMLKKAGKIKFGDYQLNL
ncbi:MAG: PTS sugar transporter subunit IIC [Eubacteriales bacterium]|nr:PTS sugar transporter subunit IIC [Eubacteriales bacterium]MDY3333181.1 PTS sugar transporter subunit IIC [Gallibacter sp.]